MPMPQLLPTWLRRRPDPAPAPEPRPAPPACGIRVVHHDDWSAILLRGRLDFDSARRVQDALDDELRRSLPVIIELAGLEYSDVSGVRALRRSVSRAALLRPPVPIEIHGARGQVADLLARLELGILAKPIARS
ncbi:MAG: STAS domain-containing protein [Solirubrobacterales bacterium]